jgi:signal transduction histidine kinase
MNRFRYRQVLFLVALILPSLVIAVVGLRNSNETSRKLTRFATDAIGLKISGRLERIKDGAIANSSTRTGKHPDPAVVLVASLLPSNGRDILAWHGIPQFGPEFDKYPEFAREIARAKSFEQVQNYESAAAAYRTALNASKTMKEAASEISTWINGRLRELELGAKLQRDFPLLRLRVDEWSYGDGGEYWLLMTATLGDVPQPLVLVVRAEEVVKPVRDEFEAQGNGSFQIRPATSIDYAPDESIHLQSEWPVIAVKSTTPAPNSGPSEFLGPSFPGLLIVFPSGALDEQRQFYTVSLALVLTLTIVGWYLIARDTFREARSAEMRSQFVSNVSHELKTPLTAIRTFAETLQLHSPADPRIQKEFLDTIVSESERLTRLLKNVLDFSRIERGERSYHLNAAHLADIVRSAARTMEFPLSQQGFTLHVDIGEGIPPVRMDRDAMEQAILNLLSNAMKYSGQNREITLTLRSDKESALIQVTDHGIGIALEEQNLIFGRFYRVASPENQSIAGSGLGLTLIAHVAKGHGGTIEVESALGKGSTFSLRIPFNGNGHS